MSTVFSRAASSVMSTALVVMFPSGNPVSADALEALQALSYGQVRCYPRATEPDEVEHALHFVAVMQRREGLRHALRFLERFDPEIVKMGGHRVPVQRD